MSNRVFTVWVVYYDPLDFPGKFVVRQQHALPNGAVAYDFKPCVRDTLEEARACIPEGLFWMPRAEQDVRAIVETWF